MSVSLTERAAAHVRRMLAAQGRPDAALRLGVRTTGCSGYTYTLQPEDETHADDSVFECHGVRVVVDRASLLFIAGTEVDFAREGLNEALRFNNPNVKATCGCGESFSV